MLALAAAGFAFFRWSQRVVTFDDAYISYRYAKNLTEGAGMVFNEGLRIEGYTNLAWTLLSAAAIAVGFDPLSATRAAGVFCYAAIGATLTVLWLRWNHGEVFGWLGGLALWLVFARTGFAAHAGSGLETMAVALLILGVGVTAFELDLPRWVSAALASVLCLLRADAVLVIPVVTALWVLREATEGHGVRRGLTSAGRWSVIPVGFVAAQMLFRVGYYGELLPNTYWAKAGGAYAWPRGAFYLGTVVEAVPEVGGLLLVALSGLSLARGRSRMVIGYGLLYILRVGGDFME